MIRISLIVLILGAIAAAVGAGLRRRTDDDFSQNYEGDDMVDHASMSSFPASDAPAY